MSLVFAVSGALFLRVGLLTSVDATGVRELVSPGLAGSGAAMMLAVACGQVFA